MDIPYTSKDNHILPDFIVAKTTGVSSRFFIEISALSYYVFEHN